MSITLKDDAASDVVYVALHTIGNSTTYIGPTHSDIVNDKLIISSTPPKRSATTYNNRRSKLNYVASVEVATPDGGVEQKDMKMEINVSIPVGTSEASIAEALARIADIATQATLINDITVVGKTQL
jgi:hypothetical protein